MLWMSKLEPHGPKTLLRDRSVRSAFKLIEQKITEAERAIEEPRELLGQPVHPFVRKCPDRKE
jgi:hypothetical protein